MFRISTTNLSVLFVLGMTVTVAAQLTMIHELPSSPPFPLSTETGSAFATVGDVDGDGHDDFVIGQPAYDFNRGRVVMVSGADASTLWTAVGGAIGDRFGFAVDGAGHLDGDAVPDLIVGSPGAASATGAITLLSGVSGFVLNTVAGSYVGERFGHSVAGVGDMDDDGILEFAVGAPFYVGANGRLFIYSGVAATCFYSIVASGELGTAVAGVGDFDGDGRPDVAVGAPGDSGGTGRVTVYGAPCAAPCLSLIQILSGGAPNGRFGAAVARAGDVDGNGHDDLIVGSPQEPGSLFASGAARVQLAPSGAVAHTFLGTALSDFGASVAGAGDVDGDGLPDLVVGAPGDGFTGTASGTLHVFSGYDGAQLGVLAGQFGSAGNFGHAVAGGLDVDGDGLSDVIGGDPEGETVRVAGFQLSRPGSGEDLALRAAVNGGPLRRWPDLHVVAPGDTMLLRMDSSGAYQGTVPIVLGRILPTGAVPVPIPGYPEIHLDGGAVVLHDGNAPSPFGPNLLPPNGINLAYVAPPGLAGKSAIIQGVCLAPSAATGHPITATDAHEFQF